MNRDADTAPVVSSTQQLPSREILGLEAPSVWAAPRVASASTRAGSANLLRITTKSGFLFFLCAFYQSLQNSYGSVGAPDFSRGELDFESSGKSDSPIFGLQPRPVSQTSAKAQRI